MWETIQDQGGKAQGVTLGMVPLQVEKGREVSEDNCVNQQRPREARNV